MTYNLLFYEISILVIKSEQKKQLIAYRVGLIFFQAARAYLCVIVFAV